MDGPSGTLLDTNTAPFAVIIQDIVTASVGSSGNRQIGAEEVAVVAHDASPTLKTTGAFQLNAVCVKSEDALCHVIGPLLSRSFFQRRWWFLAKVLPIEVFELCNDRRYYPKLTPTPYGKIWTAQPKIEWVREIVQACDKAGIPVFLKQNSMPLFEARLWDDVRWAFSKRWELRQEFPNG